MASLDEQLRAELERRGARHLRRRLRAVPPGVIDLASNDYLGLARHPDVVTAACDAVRTYGAGARASRLISGETDLHERLEAELAAFKSCQAALVLPSGYHANLAVITALAGAGTRICCDKRNHASLIDACRLAGARGADVRYYHSLHKLWSVLEARPAPSRRLIVTDTVFSMDGDLADLRGLAALAAEREATLVLDDAHGTGTLGATGRGAVEHFGLAHDSANLIHIGTLSKAIGSQGGFVAGSRVLIDWLVNAARPFIYTTGLNPAACGAALAALRVIQQEPQRRARLVEVKHFIANGLRALGFEVREQPSPILPVVVGDAGHAVALSQSLLEHGVWCPAIRPPTVPAGTARLRVTASAALTDEELERVLAAFSSSAGPDFNRGG